MKFKYVGLITVGMSLGLMTTVSTQASATGTPTTVQTRYYPITAKQS